MSATEIAIAFYQMDAFFIFAANCSYQHMNALLPGIFFQMLQSQASQADANAAVTDMKAGVEQVDIGVELAGKAGTSIRDIKQGSSRVGEAVNGIADALREQTASSHDIAQNMENIAQQVERNHGQTMQTSEAAANIKKLIVVLRKNIAHFRL